ncbi:NAD(P)-dependent alcohol dehydrogenase [Microbacterium aurum]
MKAVQYREVGRGPELVEVEIPEPGPGEIRLKVTAAGLCHTDWSTMNTPAELLQFPLPITLGHEGAGIVDKLGAGVRGIELGGSYAVYGPRGCGLCRTCAQGQENFCPHVAELDLVPPGFGKYGAMAEYMIVEDARYLVPLGELDPVKTVSLTDAGLTPYAAITASADKLRPGGTAVVLGAGGLGHIGIQVLRAISPVTVIALDVNDEKLALARSVGAHHTLLSDHTAVDKIRELTGGAGADAVFDFAGVQPTIDIARQVVAMDGAVQIVGIGGGTMPAGFFSTPFGASVRAPYWGSRSELFDVIELARAGMLSVHTEQFALDDAVTAYDKLHRNEIQGRAVVIP